MDNERFIESAEKEVWNLVMSWKKNCKEWNSLGPVFQDRYIFERNYA